ncbi:hypothetical protein ONZ43_g2242 [Nemania bipapillata]|uniref:Uncharacterized protein n=1 Tax=Nemania bipapillata TaxID=110536 RepID=A0ACC2J1C6_9PEZI|nr:hypothetical protein ONZ43_g2242 [Nemania bipapillata]
MSQTQQLEQATARLATFPEAIRNQIMDGHAKFLSTWDPSKTIQVGDKLPEFRMTDATGKEVTSASLLANGPLLITFALVNTLSSGTLDIFEKSIQFFVC